MLKISTLLTALLLTICVAAPMTAQDQTEWPNLDPILFAHQAGNPDHVEASRFFPSHSDPSQANEAVAILHSWIEGSAGSVSISVGHYTISHAPFQITFNGHIQNVWGHSPRDTAFFPDRIELTTTTLKDGEARCCPTGVSRYAIDRQTLTGHLLWSK